MQTSAGRMGLAVSRQLSGGSIPPTPPTPSGRGYIEDGLVHMWDGEWNAGVGIHDDNATVWKDLVGSFDLPINPLCDIGTKGIHIGTDIGGGSFATNIVRLSEPIPNYSTIVTIEVCYYALAYYAQNKYPQLGLVNLSYDNFLGLIKTSIGTNSYLSCLSRKGFAFNTTSLKEDSRTSMSSNPETLTFNGNTSDYPEEDYPVGSQGFELLNSTWLNGSVRWIASAYCVRLYTRKLTAAEIQHNYAIDQAVFMS